MQTFCHAMSIKMEICITCGSFKELNSIIAYPSKTGSEFLKISGYGFGPEKYTQIRICNPNIRNETVAVYLSRAI